MFGTHYLHILQVVSRLSALNLYVCCLLILLLLRLLLLLPLWLLMLLDLLGLLFLLVLSLSCRDTSVVYNSSHFSHLRRESLGPTEWHTLVAMTCGSALVPTDVVSSPPSIKP